MKIVFVNDRIHEFALGDPPIVGGAERQQWLLARALAATGRSVTVGVRKTLGPGERCVVDNVEFVGIGQGQILSAWYQFLLSERADWWYRRCADWLLGPAVEIAKLAGVRSIFALGLDLEVWPRRALYRHPRRWPFYAWGLWRADRIFVQHRGQFSGLRPQWQSKAHVVPNLVRETETIKPHSERAKYVAWVGMLRRTKRPDVLIKIAQKAPTIRFVACGGPTTFMSPSGYSERVIDEFRTLPNLEYRGQVAPDKALQIIADAAILLSTSDEEGFPNVFLEAWASGTPVISLKTDPAGVFERAGLGKVSGDIDGAIADINAIIDSSQWRDEIATKARRYIKEIHGETAVIKTFEYAIKPICKLGVT